MKTRSEEVFEKICMAQGYSVEPLVTRAGQAMRTADFRVSHQGQSFISEIEENRPNQDDLRQIKEFREKGSTTGGGKIGSRARSHIREAADQLKAHLSEQVPLVIVLYNNGAGMGWPMHYLEPWHIAAAMYGDRVVHVPLVSGAARRPDRHGGGRTLTLDEKLYISAVAVISDYDDSTMIFYHNQFAQRSLPHVFFTGPQFRHLKKSEETSTKPWEWVPRD